MSSDRPINQDTLVVKESCNVTLNLEVKALQISDDLHAFSTKVTYGSAVPTLLSEYLNSGATSFGLCTKSDLDDYLLGEAVSIKPVKDFRIVKPRSLNEVARKGFCSIELEKVGTDIVKKFKDGTYSINDVVKVDFGGDMLFDTEGNPLPLGKWFNYINGLHNGNFHMEKALSILKQHPRVTFVKDTSEVEEPCITPIPHYNCDEVRSDHIQIIFEPTKDEMIRMWDLAKRYGKAYPSTKLCHAIMHLDLLGLFSGGAAKHDIGKMYFG